MFKNSLEIIRLNKPNISDFAKERNELLRKSKAEWIFFLDSDETISPNLKSEVYEAIKNPDINGYYVIRRDIVFDKELRYGEFASSGWFGSAKILRLAKKGSGKWKRAVHEYWNIKGERGMLKNPLYHHPHPTLRKFIKSINHFSTLHAKALRYEGKRSSLIKIVVWPPGKFVYNYFFRFGFLDGMQGFVVALMMSLHSFLSWSKLYFLYS